nr:immunoglobulin light chain junction region [Macaca mulatta]MOV81572.1 immunoglobulin light chain junction region [Macaca mulatta]MOV83174.1 immunoglobulin light chain junction region [Macaca mulatta]
CQQGKSNPRTF